MIPHHGIAGTLLADIAGAWCKRPEDDRQPAGEDGQHVHPEPNGLTEGVTTSRRRMGLGVSGRGHLGTSRDERSQGGKRLS